tara:strand:- start:5663 stop:6970 length:1308 start_codon:yes stop_codon:yes gene_type:complete
VSGFGYTVLGFGSHPNRGPDTSYTLSELGYSDVASAGTEAVVELMNSPSRLFITTEPGSGEKIKGFAFDDASLPDFTTTPAELSFNNQSPRGNCFADSGSSLYVVGQASPYLQRKTLSTPFDITSVSATTTLNIASFGATQGIAFNNDGSTMYIPTSNNADVKVSTLSTSYDITSSISTSTVSLAVSDDDGDTIAGMTGIRFKPDGTKVFVSYYADNHPKVAEFSLSTPFDMTTKSFVSSLNFEHVLGRRVDGSSTVNAMIAGFDWNSDGTLLYAVSIHPDIDTNEVVVAEYGEPSALSLSLNTTATTIDLRSAVGGVPPDQSANVDSSAGDANSTATATGGAGGYSFAWTVTETADDGQNGSSCAILAEGTKTNAQYNTATFRVTVAAQLAGSPPGPVDPPPQFSTATYRLRCTVTDANGDTATADYTVTIQGA